jgi:hypothetical protein
LGAKPGKADDDDAQWLRQLSDHGHDGLTPGKADLQQDRYGP